MKDFFITLNHLLLQVASNLNFYVRFFAIKQGHLSTLLAKNYQSLSYFFILKSNSSYKFYYTLKFLNKIADSERKSNVF